MYNEYMSTGNNTIEKTVNGRVAKINFSVRFDSCINVNNRTFILFLTTALVTFALLQVSSFISTSSTKIDHQTQEISAGVALTLTPKLKQSPYA